MHQTTHFFNLGYGWLCKHCSAEDTEQKHRGPQKNTALPLAKWVEEEHWRGLVCPRCGIAEDLNHGFRG